MIGPGEDPDMVAEILSRRVAPDPQFELPWRAWHALSADRQHTLDGFGHSMGSRIVSRPQPIPWSAMRAWCGDAGLDADETEQTMTLIVALDGEFLRHRNRRLDDEIRRFLK